MWQMHGLLSVFVVPCATVRLLFDRASSYAVLTMRGRGRLFKAQMEEPGYRNVL